MKNSDCKADRVRTIVMGMVTRRRVLCVVVKAVKKCGPKLFQSPAENLIVRWAMRHYRKYDDILGWDIQGYFAEWAEGRDTGGETYYRIERFLEELFWESIRENLPDNDSIIEMAKDEFGGVGE